MTYKKLQLSLNKKINLGLASGLVILLVVGLVSYRNIHMLSGILAERKTSYENRIELGNWLTNLVDAETAERGFLITGDETYLAPYNSAFASRGSEARRLNDPSESTEFRAKVMEIDKLSVQEFGILSSTIDLRRTQGSAVAQAALAQNTSKAIMDTIRQDISSIASQEQLQTEQSTIEAAQIEAQTKLIVITGTAIAVQIMIVAIYIVNRDLAKRMQTQEALAHSEAKSKAIIDNLSEGLIVVNANGSFGVVNKAAGIMLAEGMPNTSPELWSTVYEVYMPDKVTLFPPDQLPLVRGLNGEEMLDEEIYVMNRNTHVGKSISVSSTPVLQANGTLLNTILMFNDITARKLADDKIAAEKAKAEAILGSIGDGVMAVDHSGKIILFNHAAETISGVSLKEALNQPYDKIAVFYNSKDNTLADGFIKTALSGEKAGMARHTSLRKKDGTAVPVADSAAPILDINGMVDGAVVIFRDITAEQDLGSMKDDFLSIASHELRTPMGAIRANLSMILGGDYGLVNKDLVEPLTDMKASTIRLVDLVNDLLSVSRIEAGRMTYKLAEFDINELLRSTVSSLAALGKEKGVLITLTPADTGMAQADVSKIQEVLNNLIGNSLKFTDKGAITVSPSMQKDMIEVLVSDTGMGITPVDQKTLFDKFTQITSAQVGRPIGTGLGLYISRETIRKMGGELWIKSSVPGKGSTFAFTLPKAQTEIAIKTQQALTQEMNSGIKAKPNKST